MGFARSVYTLTLCGEKRDSCVCVPVMGDSTVTYRKRKATHNAVVTVDLCGVITEYNGVYRAKYRNICSINYFGCKFCLLVCCNPIINYKFNKHINRQFINT